MDKRNNGIIKADIKGEFKIKTQKELNTFFGLDKGNDIYVNGYLVEGKEQSISVKSMSKIELLKSSDFRLKKPVLNITIQ